MNHAKSGYLIKLSGIGTALFLLIGVVASIQSSFEVVYVIVSLTMFSVGVFLGMRAFAQSVSKSRYEIITTIDLIKLPQDIFNLNFNKIKNLDGWGAQSVANLKYSINLRKKILVFLH